MRLTATEEYGLRCLVQVARGASHPGRPTLSIRQVAEAEGMSPEYVGKVLSHLRRCGLVESERGASGGYRLAEDVLTMELSDVMARLDSPIIDDTFCAKHSGQNSVCVHTSACTLRALWSSVDRAVQQVLSGITLADLIGGNSGRIAPERGRVGAAATEAS